VQACRAAVTAAGEDSSRKLRITELEGAA